MWTYYYNYNYIIIISTLHVLINVDALSRWVYAIGNRESGIQDIKTTLHIPWRHDEVEECTKLNNFCWAVRKAGKGVKSRLLYNFLWSFKSGCCHGLSARIKCIIALDLRPRGYMSEWESSWAFFVANCWDIFKLALQHQSFKINRGSHGRNVQRFVCVVMQL